MKNYRYLGEEAEALGKRLDAARKSLANAKSEWSKHYWQQTVERMLFQWRHLPALHDGDAVMQIIPRWTVSYDYYERDDGVGHGFSERLLDKFNEQTNLDESWNRVREQRLARNQ